MKNEFGVKLDSNGYAPSIMMDCEGCYCCGKMGDLARHEVFHGPNRTKSKALGCWVNLCPTCHDKVHTKNPEMDWQLHWEGQIKAMEYYGWSIKDFRKRFGKSYV